MRGSGTFRGGSSRRVQESQSNNTDMRDVGFVDGRQQFDGYESSNAIERPPPPRPFPPIAQGSPHNADDLPESKRASNIVGLKTRENVDDHRRFGDTGQTKHNNSRTNSTNSAISEVLGVTTDQLYPREQQYGEHSVDIAEKSCFAEAWIFLLQNPP